MTSFINYLLLERNIVNIKEIEEWIEDFIHYDLRGDVKKWLRSNLKNFMLRDYQNIDVFNPEAETLYIMHKVKKEPWLKKAIERKEDLWTVRLPIALENKIFHILDYFHSNPNVNISRMSVPEAIRQSEEWTEQLNKKAIIEEDPDGIKEIRKYPDGFKWVKVTSRQSLEREGKLMSHCVGSYCDRVALGNTEIYSLRDKKNMPHCTVEVRQKEIIQMQGKGNSEVDEKYRKYCKDFILNPIIGSKWKAINSGSMEEFHLVAIKGTFYDAANMSTSERKILLDELMYLLFDKHSAYDKRWAVRVLEDLDLDHIFGKANAAGNIVYAAGGVDKSIRDKIREILEKKMTLDLAEYYSEYFRSW